MSSLQLSFSEDDCGSSKEDCSGRPKSLVTLFGNDRLTRPSGVVQDHSRPKAGTGAREVIALKRPGRAVILGDGYGA
jgi:hypothetical protein